MPKSLSSFLEDCRREIPNEVVHVEREVDPARYDVSAIIKHLGAARKFPLLVFDRPRNLHGRVSDFKLVMNFTISQRKTQIALGIAQGDDPRADGRGVRGHRAQPRRPGAGGQPRGAGDGERPQRRRRGPLRAADHAAPLHGRRPVHHPVHHRQRPPAGHLQRLLPPHGDQVPEPHHPLPLAASSMDHLPGPRGPGAGVPGGHGAGAPPGFLHGRLLHRAVRGERVRRHRRLPGRAAPGDAFHHLGRRPADPRGRGDRHRGRADPRRAHRSTAPSARRPATWDRSASSRSAATRCAPSTGAGTPCTSR